MHTACRGLVSSTWNIVDVRRREPHMTEEASTAQAPHTRILRVGEPMYGGSFSAHAEAVEATSDVPFSVSFVNEGELVKASAPQAEGKRSSQPAELIEVIQSSPNRVTPDCRHFGMCGGCQYQHISQEAQLQTKQQVLADLLQGAQVVLPSNGIQIHAAEAWQYRNRVRLRMVNGRVGYSRRNTNDFLPIDECPIASPLLWRTAVQMEQHARLWPAGAVEVELFATGDDSALQLSLHLDATVESVDRDAPQRFRQLCNCLREEVPELRGAGLLVQAASTGPATRRVQQRQRVEIAQWGEPALTYMVAGEAYLVSRNAFFQVNRWLTEQMIALVADGRGGALALDLFAGAGLFSQPLTRTFQQVIAVEIGQPAASDLQRLLRLCGPQHRAEQQTTLAFLQRWNRTSRAQVPDLVVADPPRAGLGSETVRELLKIGARELVYVSCDPTTFARDARTLVESRYTVEELHLLDLFPQTFHMETIAVFRRR